MNETVLRKAGPDRRVIGRRGAVGIAAAGLVLSLAGLPAFGQVRLFQPPEIVRAAREGDVEDMRSLLMSGTRPDTPAGENGETPLMVAAGAGNIAMMELLLQYNANPNRTDNNSDTALHLGAAEGYDDVVALLLERGADPNLSNRQGETPLMSAVRSGSLPTVSALLDGGAQVDVLDYTGRSALDWAQAGRNRQIVDLLEEAGA